MEKIYLDKKTVLGNEFYYKDFGSGYHGRPSFRLWVNKGLVRYDEKGNPYIPMPCEDATIIITEKGNKVMKPLGGHTVFDLYVPCGYRGSSSITVIKPNPVIELSYVDYRSPCGRLGVSEGKLVVINGTELIYEWSRTGRTYGSPKQGITRIYKKGDDFIVEELDNIDNQQLEDLLDNL